MRPAYWSARSYRREAQPAEAFGCHFHQAGGARQFQDRERCFQRPRDRNPLCILIPNENTKSGDYEATRALARPGHADYTAYCKYHGFEDYRGGGHFSGRLTAPLVAAGAVAMYALEQKGIRIGTYIARCAQIADRAFGDLERDLTFFRTALSLSWIRRRPTKCVLP